jgi:hypothetical protein
MFDQESRRQIISVAQANGIDPAALLAVALVESAGTPFWNIGGRMEPAIRFEGHYFYRILKTKNSAKFAAAVAQGLARQSAGQVPNPPNSQRYGLLARAKAIDADAAIESISWGLGQVMGANWSSLGYASAQQLEQAARSGVAGQVDLMVRFIRTKGLMNALNSRDWHRFASGYNGSNYAKNGYHTKMRDAYARFAADLGGGGGAGPTDDPLTSDQPSIRDIQLLLKNMGYDPGPIDGDWGPLTAAAVTVFQKRNGLTETGTLDLATLARLHTDGSPRIDPRRAVETEGDLAKKGSQTIKLAKNGRLFSILSMIGGALGFGGSQNMFGDGSVVAKLAGDGSTVLPLLLKLGVAGVSGGGLWVALAGLGFMLLRNSNAVAARRLEDHREGWNIKFQ